MFWKASIAFVLSFLVAISVLYLAAKSQAPAEQPVSGPTFGVGGVPAPVPHRPPDRQTSPPPAAPNSQQEKLSCH